MSKMTTNAGFDPGISRLGMEGKAVELASEADGAATRPNEARS